MDDDVNRLAKGLMRDELRSLPKVDFDKSIEGLRKHFARYKMQFAQRAGATAKQVLATRTSMLKFLDQNHYRFNRVVQKITQPGPYKGTEVTTAFAWIPVKSEFARTDAGIAGVFAEETLQLAWQETLLNKELAGYKYQYQRITLSNHVLYRMIDREVVEREPLAYLSSQIFEWLPWINALMLMSVNNGFIPFAQGGLVIQTYGITEPDDHNGTWIAHDRWRVGVKSGLGYFEGGNNLPSPTNCQHPDGSNKLAWLDYRITTYLTDHQLDSSRLWLKLEYARLREKFPKEFELLSTLNTSYHAVEEAQAVFENPDHDFMIALKKLTRNPRFLDASRSAC